VIRTRSTARIFLVCIYLLNYFINCKFPIMWQGSKVLWNETRGRKFHGTFVPGDESILSPGTKVPGDESSWYHCYPWNSVPLHLRSPSICRRQFPDGLKIKRTELNCPVTIESNCWNWKKPRCFTMDCHSITVNIHCLTHVWRPAICYLLITITKLLEAVKACSAHMKHTALVW